MLKRQMILVVMMLALGLMTVVFLISCKSMTSIQGQTLNPKDPNYLTKKYLADLKNGNNSQRTKAAWELGASHMKRIPEVVPALIRALNDHYPKVRANAAGALSRIGEEARPAESALRQSLTDSYGKTVLNAAIALRRLKVPDKELIPAVRKVLYDQKGTTRVRAARMLRKMREKDEEIITVLAEVLTDSDEQARFDALGELNKRELKPIPKKVSVPVIGLLKDYSEKVRSQAALYLGNSYIPIPEARDPLIEALDDGSSLVVKYAARALGNYGKSAKGAVSKLYMILETHPDDHARGEACEALGHIGVPRKEIAHRLVKVLSSDPGPRARKGAASGLRDLKYRDAMVLDALKKASTQDANSSVRTISEITYEQLKGNN